MNVFWLSVHDALPNRTGDAALGLKASFHPKEGAMNLEGEGCWRWLNTAKPTSGKKKATRAV